MRARWTFIVVAVAALVLASCGGGAKRAATHASGASATSVVEDTTSTTATAASTPAPRAASKATPTTAPRAGAAPAASAASATGGPVPATPPPAGPYRYDTSGATQSSGGASHPMPSVTTLIADKASGAGQRAARDLGRPH